MPKELTNTQTGILNFIIDFRGERGYPPTLAEIAFRFNYRNRSTVQQHLQALEKKGFIRRNPNSARGIELTLEDKYFEPKPVLGEVAAGIPLTIYPDSIDTIDLPTIVRMPRDSFLLRVKGDSLKDAYIFSGDVVIVNPNTPPKNGHFVVVIIDNEAVVKRFNKTDEYIELHSENPEYEPIIIKPGNPGFKMVGVVVGIYRSMQVV